MTYNFCKQGYHVDETCSGVADATVLAMGQPKRDKGRCRTCRSGEIRSGQSSGLSQESGHTAVSQLAAIDVKLQSPMSLRTSVNGPLSLPAKVDRLLEWKPTVDLLRQAVKNVQVSIEFLSGQYDSVLASVSANEKLVCNLQADTSSHRENVSEQARAISSK